jgi:FkbM family methyltransferase
MSIVELQSGKSIFVTNRDDFIQQCLLKYGYFAKTEVLFLSSIISSGDNIIEIGTNIGSHTIFLSEKVGKIYCFEPQHDVFRTLCTNLTLNKCNNVIPYNYGISNKEEIKYFSRREVNEKNTGEFSILRLPGCEQSELPLGCEQSELPQISLQNDFIKTQKLSYFKELFSLSSLSLIKIDVEEMEITVLEECIPLVLKFFPDLFIEYSNKTFHVIVEILRTLNSLSNKKYFIYYFNTSQEQRRIVADTNIYCSIRENKNLFLVPDREVHPNKNILVI